MTEIEAIIVFLASNYPSTKLTALNIAAYVDALKDVDPRLLMRVAKQHALESPFFPAIADLMRGVTAQRLPVGANLTPDEAWQDVTANTPSHYGTPDEYARAITALGPFLHSVLMAVGGFTAIQTQPSEQVRRAFVAKFKAAKDRLVTKTICDTIDRQMPMLGDGTQEIEE